MLQFVTVAVPLTATPNSDVFLLLFYWLLQKKKAKMLHLCAAYGITLHICTQSGSCISESQSKTIMHHRVAATKMGSKLLLLSRKFFFFFFALKFTYRRHIFFLIHLVLLKLWIIFSAGLLMHVCVLFNIFAGLGDRLVLILLLLQVVGGYDGKVTPSHVWNVLDGEARNIGDGIGESWLICVDHLADRW